MNIRVTVGLNIQRLRRAREISQEELSLRSGCTRGYLSGIETGKKNPSIEFLAKLAKSLDSDMSEFFVLPIKQETTKKTAARKSPAGTKKIKNQHGIN